jgi:hypothetical protein
MLSAKLVPGTAVDCSLVYGPPDRVPRYTKYPVTLEVLAVQLSVTEWETGVVADPDKATTGAVPALLDTVMLPE